MAQRISLITLAVGDLEKAKKFYEDIGFCAEKMPETDGSIYFFQLQGQVLAIYPADELSAEQRKTGIRPVPGGITLGINTRTKEDVDTFIQQVLDAGGVLLKSAAATEWGGDTGYVADPDGHSWEISWAPFFPLKDKG
jgi:predicted lactoylglutathione lyase